MLCFYNEILTKKVYYIFACLAQKSDKKLYKEHQRWGSFWVALFISESLESTQSYSFVTESHASAIIWALKLYANLLTLDLLFNFLQLRLGRHFSQVVFIYLEKSKFQFCQVLLIALFQIDGEHQFH